MMLLNAYLIWTGYTMAGVILFTLCYCLVILKAARNYDLADRPTKRRK